MGYFLTIYPIPLKNFHNSGGFCLNILKGSAVTIKITFIGDQIRIHFSVSIISGPFHLFHMGFQPFCGIISHAIFHQLQEVAELK